MSPIWLYIRLMLDPKEAVEEIGKNLKHLRYWMRVSKLQLNPDKMEVFGDRGIALRVCEGAPNTSAQHPLSGAGKTRLLNLFLSSVSWKQASQQAATQPPAHHPFCSKSDGRVTRFGYSLPNWEWELEVGGGGNPDDAHLPHCLLSVLLFLLLAPVMGAGLPPQMLEPGRMHPLRFWGTC